MLPLAAYKQKEKRMKKVKVLIGNYGSGKSELALNFAMQAAARMNPNAEEGLSAFLEKRKASFQ